MLTAATRKVSWNMTLSFVLCNVFKSSCIAFLCTKTLSYTHTCTVYICLKWRNLCCGILLTSDFDKIATWPTGHDRCCSGCHKAWKLHKILLVCALCFYVRLCVYPMLYCNGTTLFRHCRCLVVCRHFVAQPIVCGYIVLKYLCICYIVGFLFSCVVLRQKLIRGLIETSWR